MKAVLFSLVAMSPLVSSIAFAKYCEFPEYKAPKGFVCDSRGFWHPIPVPKFGLPSNSSEEVINDSELAGQSSFQLVANSLKVTPTEISADVLVDGKMGTFKSLYFKEYGYALLFPRFEMGETSSFISAGVTTPATICKMYGLKIGTYPESAVEFAATETPKVNVDENFNFGSFTKGGVVYRYVKCFQN